MAIPRRPIVGLRFGRLLVLSDDGIGTRRKAIVQCDCGEKTSVAPSSLTGGGTESCGCLMRQRNQERMLGPGSTRTHGEGGRDTITVEYRAWQGAKRRCYDVAHGKYKDYGARGISVCNRWVNSYETFLEDMGRKPSRTHSLDRIDVNGNYEPSNCRWATPKEQANNRRPPRRAAR